MLLDECGECISTGSDAPCKYPDTATIMVPGRKCPECVYNRGYVYTIGIPVVCISCQDKESCEKVKEYQNASG